MYYLSGPVKFIKLLIFMKKNSDIAYIYIQGESKSGVSC